MPEQEQPDLFEQFFAFLSQILMPVWGDLIALIPYALIALALAGFLYLAWIWRRASERNRPRLPRRLAVGAPPPGVHLPGPSRWPFVVPIGLTLLFFGLVLPARDEAGDVVFPVNMPLLLVGLVVSLVAVVGWLRDAMKEWRTAEVGAHATHDAEQWTGGHGAPMAIDARVSAMNVAQGTAALEAGPMVVREPPPGVHMPGPSPWPFFAPIAITLILFGLILHPALVIGGLVLAVIAAGGWLREAAKEWRSTEAVGHAVPETRDPVRAWPRRLVPIFAWVIALSIAVAMLPLFFGFLDGLRPAEATPTPLAVPAVPEIEAPNAQSFDREELVVPAGRDFELVFRNNDEGVPHNVEIDESSARTNQLFEGEIINGVAEITYQVPALAEGDYYFLCSVHPNMNGTVLARPETPSGPGQSPGGSPAGSPGASPGGSPAESPGTSPAPGGSPAASPGSSPNASPGASPGGESPAP